MSIPRSSPAATLMGGIVTMAFLDLMVPIAAWIEWPWNLGGLLPIGVGGALIWLSMSALSRHGTSAEPFQAASTLVTVGTFRISRNPMYLGAALILLGMAAILGTATPFLVVPAYLVVMDLGVVREEESAMEERFGAEYARYRANVRRWL